MHIEYKLNMNTHTINNFGFKRKRGEGRTYIHSKRTSWYIYLHPLQLLLQSANVSIFSLFIFLMRNLQHTYNIMGKMENFITIWQLYSFTAIWSCFLVDHEFNKANYKCIATCICWILSLSLLIKTFFCCISVSWEAYIHVGNCYVIAFPCNNLLVSLLFLPPIYICHNLFVHSLPHVNPKRMPQWLNTCIYLHLL